MGQVDSSKASGDDQPMVSDLQDRQFRKYEVAEKFLGLKLGELGDTGIFVSICDNSNREDGDSP